MKYTKAKMGWVSKSLGTILALKQDAIINAKLVFYIAYLSIMETFP